MTTTMQRTTVTTQSAVGRPIRDGLRIAACRFRA